MADDIDISVIKKTQELLGTVIKKPVLTEKSLKKPPFRFLHDIITNVCIFSLIFFRADENNYNFIFKYYNTEFSLIIYSIFLDY